MKILHVVGARPNFMKVVPITSTTLHFDKAQYKRQGSGDVLSLLKGQGSGRCLPASEAASREVLSLPMYPELTEEQQVMVAEAIRGFYGLRRTTNPSAWLRTGVGRSLDADDG